MSRSSKKGPFCDERLLNRVREQNKSGKKAGLILLTNSVQEQSS